MGRMLVQTTSRIVRSAVANAKMIIGKPRMADREAEMAAATAPVTVCYRHREIIGRRLEALVPGGGEHGQRLTLAARSARGGIDADVEGILVDLHELLDDNPEKGDERRPAPRGAGSSRPWDHQAREIDVEAIAWLLGAKVEIRELDTCEARILGMARAIICVDSRRRPERRKFFCRA
jgi:hypothetical protein